MTQEQKIEQKEILEGVGGWLAFFLVSIMLLSPLRGLMELQHDWLESGRAVSIVSGVIFLGITGIQVRAGFRLLNVHRPESVKYMIKVLWLTNPLIACIFILLLILMKQPISSDFDKELVGSIMYAGIWTLYLKRSVRVRNTYFAPFETPKETNPEKLD